jgi:hypothetical protein
VKERIEKKISNIITIISNGSDDVQNKMTNDDCLSEASKDNFFH